MNQTGFKSRGYGVGSIYQDWAGAAATDKSYKAPGNALRKAEGSYDPAKRNMEVWTPGAAPAEDKRHRPLDKI